MPQQRATRRSSDGSKNPKSSTRVDEARRAEATALAMTGVVVPIVFRFNIAGPPCSGEFLGWIPPSTGEQGWEAPGRGSSWSAELIERTRRIWEPRYRRKLSDDEILEVLDGVRRFNEWACRRVDSSRRTHGMTFYVTSPDSPSEEAARDGLKVAPPLREGLAWAVSEPLIGRSCPDTKLPLGRFRVIVVVG